MVCNFLLISEDLASMFTDEEVKRFRLQEVELGGRSKRRFFEVLGQPRVKQVGVKGGNYHQLSCWECASCHTRSFSCSHPELPDNYQYTDFVVREDLPRNLDSAFIIEDSVGRRLICMSPGRWMEIRKNNDVGGVLTSRLYVIPETQADRDPRLKLEENIFG